MINCESCGYTLEKNANFCASCGTGVSLKDRLTGYASRLKYQTKNTIENVKNSLDNQISQFIQDVNQNNEAKIAGIRVPTHRQNAVKNALQSIQDKYLDGSPTQTAEYSQWVEDLPARLDEHNCIVCFSKWDPREQNIVVCPHCQTGGHQEHIENWIKEKNYCPLCRSDVRLSEFVKLVDNSDSFN